MRLPETLQEWARMMDHTLLRPDATAAAIERLCQEAVTWGCYGVCVQPVHVARAAQALKGTGVAVVSVIGFPSGATTALVKTVEAVQAVGAGAREVDMVGLVGSLVEGDWKAFAEDVAAVVRAVGSEVAVKVILETGYLSDPQKEAGARLAVEAGARFVKTSTGFGPGGATVDDVRLLRRVAGTRAGVKAAGGIRSLATARAMVEAGADRLGTSSTAAILQEVTAAAASAGE